jgi:ribose transport system permease protein
MKFKNVIEKSSSVFWFTGVLIVLWIIFSPGFFRLGNLQNLLIQAAPLLVLAIGETIAILSEGIDLSVGFTLGFSGVIAAYLVQAEINLFIVIGVTIFVGSIIGLLNGISIAKGGLPPFIATLGIGNMFFGIGLIMTGGISVPAFNDSFRFIAEGHILGANFSIFLAIIVFGIMWIVMNRTKFGRNVKSLGGNAEALRLSGVNIVTARIGVYTVVGTLAGISGLMMAARTASGHPGNGLGWEFDAIAATIIGGTAFSEGFGSINKTVLGVLMIAVLRNGLNMAGVANMYQFAIIGGVVLLAIITDISLRNLKHQRKSADAS